MSLWYWVLTQKCHSSSPNTARWWLPEAPKTGAAHYFHCFFANICFISIAEGTGMFLSKKTCVDLFLQAWNNQYSPDGFSCPHGNTQNTAIENFGKFRHGVQNSDNVARWNCSVYWKQLRRKVRLTKKYGQVESRQQGASVASTAENKLAEKSASNGRTSVGDYSKLHARWHRSCARPFAL